MTGRAARAAFYFVPWAGWIDGGLGWVLSDQIGSDLVQLNCAVADPILMAAIGLMGALLAIGGGLLSFRHWLASDADTGRDHAGSRRFLALVSSMAAGLFLLVILFQTGSAFIIPQGHA